MKYHLLSAATLFAAAGAWAATPSLGQRLRTLVADDCIGVAVVTSRGDTIAVNGDRPFAMQSVVKFHQAVALAHILGEKLIDDTVSVAASDLKRDTWSPMRARAPQGGYEISPVGLLDYSLLMSDNNAADILFNRYASPSVVDSVVRAISPARDFAVRRTEAEMHADTSVVKDNWSTPADAASFINSFFTSDATVGGTIVRAVMSQPTAFGNTRIVAGIPDGKATVLHKTGTGDIDAAGRPTAVNDVAFVYYPRPDGTFGYYSLAVFVENFEGSPADAEQRIAAISKEVWEAMLVDDASVAMRNASAPMAQPSSTVRDNSSLWEMPIGAAILGAVLDGMLE